MAPRNSPTTNHSEAQPSVQRTTNHSAIIFDLFGTLVPAFPASMFRDSLYAMADAVGAGRELFRDAWIGDTHYERSVGGFATIEANVNHICESAGVTPGKEALARAAAIRLEFTRAILVPRPDAIATLTDIRDAGLRTALVSDCSAEVPGLWHATPFAPLIDVPIFSCSAGMKKPDPRIYRAACDGLGVAPERCIYVGDGMSQELTGAAALGMYPMLIAPADEEPPDYALSQRYSWEGHRIERLGEILGFIGGGR